LLPEVDEDADGGDVLLCVALALIEARTCCARRWPTRRT